MTHSQKIARSFGTHDGTFHADEVTACALLILFNQIDENKVIRTRDPTSLKQCEFVCDVGGKYDPANKLFDHHQSDYQGGLSSAGMILLYLKNSHLISQKEYDLLNSNLIMGVDAHDNGKDFKIPGVCTYSHIISSFTPIQYDCTPVEQDQAFFEALRFSINYLKRLRERYYYTQSCKRSVSEKMKQYKICLMFEQSIPWLDSFFELEGIQHPAKFVIMPAANHWKLRGIPPSLEDRMNVRIPLPLEWAGLLEEDLKKVSGIPGAVFCHKGRFTSVWETKEDAIKALKYTLNKSGIEYDDNF